MKKQVQLVAAIAVIVLSGLLSARWSVDAQDQPATSSLHVLTLQFSAAPVEPPTVEEAGEVGIFKVNPIGTVTGDLDGTFSQRITQFGPVILAPSNSVNDLVPTTTFFTIETADGIIEGYYSGPFYFPETSFPDATFHQYGQVLSVTAAYANLFLAEVFYDGVVDFEEVDGTFVAMGDSGTLIIAPR